MPKVLCVDDDADMRSLIALGLSVDGFAEVIEARDGWDAIEKCRLLWPDLILMDIMMPHLNGIEAIRRLRMMAAARTVPIIVISAKYNHELMEHALSIGANEYVTKPFTIEDLKQTIQQYVDGAVSFAQWEGRRQQELARAAANLTDAHKMESLYRLAIWQNNPPLAVNLDQLTDLAGGIIHDLRNRLGILCNYNVRAEYCLQLLESLAFFCFKPSLSRQICQGNIRQPEIGAAALTRFVPSPTIDFIFTRRTQRHQTAASGLTLKGLFDSSLLSRTLWLLCHNLIAYYRDAPHEPSLRAIEIEDCRLLDPHFGFYIKISLRQADKRLCPFPEKCGCDRVLAGDPLAIALLLLRKAVFLHGGELRFDDQGRIVIKIEDRLKPSRSEDDLDGLRDKITHLATEYTGPEPNIYPLVRKFISPLSRELDHINAEARANVHITPGERALTLIRRNCRYAQLLLQNLLWLGVGVDPPCEWVDVGDTLRSVLRILWSEIRVDDDDEPITVEVDIDPDVVNVWGNRVSLQQVFMNLIINALEAMPGGGYLWLRVFQRGGGVYAEVSDTGSGIPPSQTQQVFDLAFSTKQGRERGTGLHIVKSIINRWGGTIDMTSTVGQGTTFRICLHNLNPIPVEQPGEEYATTPSCINC